MKSPLLLVACATEIVASISTDFAVAGYRVRFAASGVDLLKYARRLRPDLIVLDPNLPDLARVYENLKQTPWTDTIPRILLGGRSETPSEAVPIGGKRSGLPGSSFDSEELLRRIEETLGVTSSSPAKVASVCTISFPNEHGKIKLLSAPLAPGPGVRLGNEKPASCHGGRAVWRGGKSSRPSRCTVPD